ncbi:sensor histidine kinase [Clostridium brassicae]|uniref:Sensor histidine kinase n=1 Tax=Clostridium brassicae TaxID=2999072 RepID=A0ABT4D5H1_9CLOT|nr:sensor histidine kinase [Clostridium brassicae]MCY6957532.1 sensor histidine kinase [Clostridium brassicae]
MIEILKNLINNLGYIWFIAFIISQSRSFKKIIQKDKFKNKDLFILSVIFGCFGILGTYVGTEVNGAIANTRIIGVMAGGILCGPFVGALAGIIAGAHRFVVGAVTITTIPCTIATIISGIVSGVLYKKSNNKNRWVYGLIGGVIMESLEMLLIIIMSKPFSDAIMIVKSIYIPMGFTNAIGIAVLILLIQNIFEEKEQIAAKQAQLALEIANKTLPYFREINEESFIKICQIIKDSIKADAVSITNKEYVLAHVGIGSDHHVKGSKIQTGATEKVINQGCILEMTSAKEINCSYENCPLKSAIVAPLKYGKEVIGTLKIYYDTEGDIPFRNRNLAIGLSQIISTQLEISKIEKLKNMANKAEIKALQAQINPHFLFNALNTIVSFIRIDPNKARELILNLSTYLRYNLEIGDEPVDIYKEIEQVKAYIDIEKARYKDKLNVIYDIDEEIDIKIPSLIIQPIVENSVKHGILKENKKGTIKISINEIDKESARVTIEDDGVGIDENIINKVYQGNMKENKIGISNVNNRLKCLYGKGLKIERLDKGTRTTFIIHQLKG